MSRDDIFIAGMHNVENCMGAIMLVKEFGVSNEIIKDVISNFRGVEHRLEYVDTIEGRRFYNDTEATNIKCTQIALSSFDKPIIIILGGLERGQDFNELTPYMSNVKGIIGIGQCRERVLDYGKSIGIDTYIYEHLRDGFDKCYEVSNEGDIILLSPASASWDQYKECEVRGDEFRELVNNLEKKNSNRVIIKLKTKVNKLVDNVLNNKKLYLSDSEKILELIDIEVISVNNSLYIEQDVSVIRALENRLQIDLIEFL